MRETSCFPAGPGEKLLPGRSRSEASTRARTSTKRTTKIFRPTRAGIIDENRIAINIPLKTAALRKRSMRRGVARK
jgi:hypothetical protein